MVLNCQKWQLFPRNRLVLLQFLCYLIGFVALIVTADQPSSPNKNANQTAELKTKLLKIIQKGNLLSYLQNECIATVACWKQIHLFTIGFTIRGVFTYTHTLFE